MLVCVGLFLWRNPWYTYSSIAFLHKLSVFSRQAHLGIPHGASFVGGVSPRFGTDGARNTKL